ncbi:hypothetical protein [Subtercola boreus]|uniref:Uncharacterized protein n=1 Tax=Subtercola boreus TaxID=120213 RepID=A0A3E0W5R7_9MICO|nr:hypothetical protein [Subtercola boreus]RFA17625.1 hypothetical protein B7R24_16875 [Subtercola boreus]RFA17649.1 hypothetical protein B7R23_17035 [Subtercola boreus]RFA24230.1 hypothetical protein B7R25_17190 [Subtercola boreus]
MAAEPSAKSKAWAIFDRICADAAPDNQHTNPWTRDQTGALRYEPDFDVLEKLLGVPLYLKAPTTSGVPALALDVWISYELRRAGFDQDATWPRGKHPRIMPAPIVNLLAGLPRKERDLVEARLLKASPLKGVVSSSANILGKNYLKQVDVVMSDWDTGPELLISTKRMDSSFGKNAANRVEESYGDAKNLRLRHPLAALGFVYGLRSTILTEEPDKAEWLIDLLQKLGREDDAYHAVALIMIEYGAELAPTDDPDAALTDDALTAAGLETSETEAETEEVPTSAVEDALANLPRVTLRHETVPEPLQPGRFLAEMINRVIEATPVNRHKEARRRRATL